MSETDNTLHLILEEIKKTNLLLLEYKSSLDLDQWIDTTDLSTKLHVSHQTIYRLRKKGILKSTKINGKIFFHMGEVNKMLSEFQSK